MPWPHFSELSFGFSFLREFERLHTPSGFFPSAPDFISQNDEAALGYDVEVAIEDSAPVFFQFKRSFVLTTHRAGEIRVGDFQHPDLYRMYLHKAERFHQRRALQLLFGVQKLDADAGSNFASRLTLYEGIYFPIPRPLEHFLIPKDQQEIRLELHCDWLDMRTARHWAADEAA